MSINRNPPAVRTSGLASGPADPDQSCAKASADFKGVTDRVETMEGFLTSGAFFWKKRLAMGQKAPSGRGGDYQITCASLVKAQRPHGVRLCWRS